MALPMKNVTRHAIELAGLNPDDFTVVYHHKGFDICTLKVADPAKGDILGYRTFGFGAFRVFDHVNDAILEIDQQLDKGSL